MQSLPDLFAELSQRETDDHVLWTRGCSSTGYGIMRVGGRCVGVHRLALLGRVPQPPGLTVTCHTPGLGCPHQCLNYRHLYWGTPLMNQRDRFLDGTNTRGERHGTTKLTEDAVRTVRRLLGQGLSQYKVAAEVGTTRANVSAIARGLSWTWLGA